MDRIAVIAGRTGKGTVNLLEPYVQSVIDAGGIPVIIPAMPGEARNIDDYLGDVQGLLLTGGGDIDPHHYSAETTTSLQSVDRARDDFELAALDWSLRTNKRVLGICRGAQMMAVHSGGSLIQDLPTQGHFNHMTNTVDFGYAQHMHEIVVEEDSLVAEILGSERRVNSEHHQAILNLPDAFRKVAWSEDGVTEAIELDDWVGVQWHPEYMANTQNEHLNFFRWLVHGRNGIKV
jgi:putative glutamine amidotransferase